MKNPIALFIVLVVFAFVGMAGTSLYLKKKKEAASAAPASAEVIEPIPAK